MMEAERRRPPNRQKSGGRESDTPLSPPLADPREFYRVAGKIVSGKKFSENILPANAEPYQPSKLEGISLRLKEIFGR